ncbi:hypothetical protein KQ310_06635 [Synechococcus sp. CS-1328]|nr:hypothetical protein [Synechococcus sp. CS-1328]
MTPTCDQIDLSDPIEPESSPLPPVKCDQLHQRLSALAKDPPDNVMVAFALDQIAQEFGRSMGVTERLYKEIRATHQEPSLDDSTLSELEELSAASAAEGEIRQLIPPRLKAGFSSDVC